MREPPQRRSRRAGPYMRPAGVATPKAAESDWSMDFFVACAHLRGRHLNTQKRGQCETTLERREDVVNTRYRITADAGCQPSSRSKQHQAQNRRMATIL